MLYRNNVLSDNIAAAFIRANIPYRVYKGRDFFSRAEIRDMFAYLWVLENPADELRLRRIINVPTRKIGDKSVETAAQVALENGMLLYDVVRQASHFPALSRGAAAMEKFGAMMENLRQQRQFLSLSELLTSCSTNPATARRSRKRAVSRSRAALSTSRSSRAILSITENDHDEASLAGFLEEMALYTDADQTGEDEDAVLMMTMHSAKGLEFRSCSSQAWRMGCSPASARWSARRIWRRSAGYAMWRSRAQRSSCI